MKIGFKIDLEKRMDAWIKSHGGMEKLEKDLEYRLKRLEKEKMYDEKMKLRRSRRMRDHGKD